MGSSALTDDTSSWRTEPKSSILSCSLCFSRICSSSMSLGPSPPAQIDKRIPVHRLNKLVPITKFTFGNPAHMRGAVAIKRSIPFRYAKRESTTIVTGTYQQGHGKSGEQHILLVADNFGGCGLNWSATRALGITKIFFRTVSLDGSASSLSYNCPRRTVFSRLKTQ